MAHDISNRRTKILGCLMRYLHVCLKRSLFNRNSGVSRCLVTLTQHNFSLDKSQTRAINLFCNKADGRLPLQPNPQREEVLAIKLRGVGGPAAGRKLLCEVVPVKFPQGLLLLQSWSLRVNFSLAFHVKPIKHQ